MEHLLIEGMIQEEIGLKNGQIIMLEKLVKN
jgi:hypothetical protein